MTDDAPEIGPIESLAEYKERIARENFRSSFGGKFSHEFAGEKPKRNWLVKGMFWPRRSFWS